MAAPDFRFGRTPTSLKGDRAGSLNEDNARVIAEQAARSSRRSQLISSAPVPDKGKQVRPINETPCRFVESLRI